MHFKHQHIQFCESLTMYSLIRPCPLLGGSQEAFTVPSSSFRQVSCRFVGGSGTTDKIRHETIYIWF